MKKLLSVLLLLALLLGIAGCMASEAPQDTAAPTRDTAQTDPITTEETVPPSETSPEATEPETTPLPTEKPVKPTEAPEDTRPRPTEVQDPHETEPEDTKPQETQPKETEPKETEPKETEPKETQPAPQKSYTGKEEVAAYIAKHGRLPDNFITKKQAEALGWKSGSLEKYAPGMCIGGDRFYNREGLLPAGTYYECDIDTLGASKRGAKRIVFTKSGDIYYTSDHYASFYRYLGPNQWEKV